MNASADQLTQLGKIAVLYGGSSAEREISLLTGNAVADAIERQGLPCVRIDTAQGLVDALQLEKPGAAFIALHGPGGEDGSVQGLLQYMGIGYTGSGVLGSALALNKQVSKQVWRGCDIATADWSQLNSDTDFNAAISALGGSAMVKPVNEGSSIGMARADSGDALRQAWQDALQYDQEVIAEAWIDGPEFTVPLLAGKALPVVQMVSSDTFYTYEAKYHSDETRYLCPAPIEADLAEQMQVLALQAFQSLHCSGWGRVDLMLHPTNGPLVLEANTVPGMTSHSLVPMSAAQAGLDFDQLVLRILQTIEVDR